MIVTDFYAVVRRDAYRRGLTSIPDVSTLFVDHLYLRGFRIGETKIAFWHGSNGFVATINAVTYNLDFGWFFHIQTLEEPSLSMAVLLDTSELRFNALA